MTRERPVSREARPLRAASSFCSPGGPVFSGRVVDADGPAVAMKRMSARRRVDVLGIAIL
jgi:hypothetical protein